MPDYTLATIPDAWWTNRHVEVAGHTGLLVGAIPLGRTVRLMLMRDGCRTETPPLADDTPIRAIPPDKPTPTTTATHTGRRSLLEER